LEVIDIKELNLRRAGRLALANGEPIISDDEAVRYIDERGFVLLVPSPDMPLPSLSAADPRPAWEGYTITDAAWQWKEVLPGRKQCAYGKFIRNRGVFISWRLFPAFYAIFGPVDGMEGEYAARSMSPQERMVLDIIQAEGPIDTRALWRETRPFFGGNRKALVQALTTLQDRFIITVAGGELDGWSLHSWDLVTRQTPEGLLDKLPSADEATRLILLQLLENAVCCTTALAASVLRLNRGAARAILEKYATAGLITQVRISGETGLFWSLAQEWAD